MSAIHTIGYGSRTIDQVIAILQEHTIAYLIDVRTAPYSRYKPEFSKAQLERELARHGIRYVFMGDMLGGQPGDEDCYVDGKVDYERVKCGEGRPETCHRSKLIGVTLMDLAIPVIHIDENDALQAQEEVIARLTGGQLDLFGEPTFQSRKQYSRE